MNRMGPDKNKKPAGESVAAQRTKAARRTERRGRGEATELACSRLMRIVQEMGANARLPGLRALREQIGVSQGTLNAALDRLEERRVLLRRERSGVFVASDLGRRNVCLICTLDFFLRSNVSPFWQLLLDRIQNLAGEHETHLTVAFAGPVIPEALMERPSDPSPLPHYLREEITAGNFDGVLSVGLPRPTTHWIEERGIPVVAFAGAARFSVTTARLPVVEQGVEALAKSGCRQIDLWLPPRSHWVDRFDLIQQAFNKSIARYSGVEGNIVPSASEVADFDTDGVYYPARIETGWEYAHRFFGPDSDKANRPDGVVVADDMLGLGALMGFFELGISVGEELQIASYANAGSPTLLGWEKRIYRIEYDIARLVEMLYETLEALMKNGKAAAMGEFVPELAFDSPEYPTDFAERYRFVRPALIPPV